MSVAGDAGLQVWTDAVVATAVFAVDPVGTGGVVLRAPAGPVRDRWLSLLKALLPAAAPVKRIPAHVSDDRLLGGLDLAATLHAGRSIAERGLLAEADGGIVVLPMAERLSLAMAARLASAQDFSEVVVERDGLGLRLSTRFGIVALDESLADEARPAPALLDRLAFRIDLTDLRLQDAAADSYRPADILAARQALDAVQATMEVTTALCTVAEALGIDSLRAALLAVRVARIAAALDGRAQTNDDDAAIAARLVLAARATRMPVDTTAEQQAADSPSEAEQNQPQKPDPESQAETPENDPPPQPEDLDRALENLVLAAARAALPPELLASLQLNDARSRAAAAGRAGVLQGSKLRGRPAGVRPGSPRAGARLNLIETLRAAAPWQTLRRSAAGARHSHAPLVAVRQSDFRVTRFKQRTQTTMIFVVDASGSAALNRLAEAKGAVELLLAECYVRRDRVALIAFRGREAQLLLPPTRSLVRAKRSLSGLPGGGATPLAMGIDCAMTLAVDVRRRGDTPIIILLTDGRANIARDGTPGRLRAEQDALGAARALRLAAIKTLFVDAAPRPQPAAATLAAAMDARYLILPYADARAISGVVRTAALQN